MKLNLADQWQLSPLTDLSIPQDDIIFPAALSSVLPAQLSEDEVRNQEWHLMHDFEIDDQILSAGSVDLVIQDIYHYAEIRINGRGVIDSVGDGAREAKETISHLQPGFNRIELLFLEQEEFFDEFEEAFGEDFLELKSDGALSKPISGLGIGTVPYLQVIEHLRVERLTVEQIWHSTVGCELLVSLNFKVFKPGLVSASITFDGVKLQVPIDMRSEHATALFQVDAPRLWSSDENEEQAVNTLKLDIDGQQFEFLVKLNPEFETQSYRLFS